jgi:mannitol-1-phosphate 5-dehydrogenase
MALDGSRTFVGFGFGAIQAGLFLYEAWKSGNFGRLVVAEVISEVVATTREAGGQFAVNIAHADHIEHARLGNIEIENPAVEADRQRLIEAIATADEIGTAIPSVKFYVSDGDGSLHRILAEGLRQKAKIAGPPAVIYAAENHNHAAEILQQKVLDVIPKAEHEAVLSRVRFLNTVVGKMSGIVTDPTAITEQGLVPVTAGDTRAFLVEAFNRILISQVAFAPEIKFQRGIEVFEEKVDLLPFEEAKLYGHNATHALAAYIGLVRGVGRIADLPQSPGIVPFLRAAFIQESGAALLKKHTGVDELFTEAGYTYYADDLLERMINPQLRDTVERVGRDAARKLGWDDRLIGVIRVALQQGITPHRYALGAAAALNALDRSALESTTPLDEWFDPIWESASPDPAERQVVLECIAQGRQRLQQWVEAGFPNLETFMQAVI